MKDEILNRIKVLIDDSMLSERAYAIEIGIKPQILNNQITGRNNLTLDTILAIVSKYDDVSMEWLIKGKGEKYGCYVTNNNTMHTHTIKDSNVNNGSGTQMIGGSDQVKELQERNKKLEERVDKLIAILETK